MLPSIWFSCCWAICSAWANSCNSWAFLCSAWRNWLQSWLICPSADCNCWLLSILFPPQSVFTNDLQSCREAKFYTRQVLPFSALTLSRALLATPVLHCTPSFHRLTLSHARVSPHPFSTTRGLRAATGVIRPASTIVLMTSSESL